MEVERKELTPSNSAYPFVLREPAERKEGKKKEGKGAWPRSGNTAFSFPVSLVAFAPSAEKGRFGGRGRGRGKREIGVSHRDLPICLRRSDCSLAVDLLAGMKAITKKGERGEKGT